MLYSFSAGNHLMTSDSDVIRWSPHWGLSSVSSIYCSKLHCWLTNWVNFSGCRCTLIIWPIMCVRRIDHLIHWRRWVNRGLTARVRVHAVWGRGVTWGCWRRGRRDLWGGIRGVSHSPGGVTVSLLRRDLLVRGVGWIHPGESVRWRRLDARRVLTRRRTHR